jgi:hypothetical protein
MCDRGFAPSMEHLLLPVQGKVKVTWEKSFVSSMRLPKISHPEITMWSSLAWFLPIFTSRMKRHSPPPAIGNMPIN